MTAGMTGKRTNRKFDLKGNGTFKASFIYDLREKVMETCNHLSKTRHFNFKRSKRADAYRELDKILSERGYPEMSDTTYHNFFNLEPYVDENGNEYFSYAEKTIAIFSDLVENYHPGKPFSTAPKPFIDISKNYELDDNLKKFLFRLYMSQNGYLVSHERNEVDENGNCIITYNVFHEAITDIHLILFDMIFDVEGKAEVVEAFDKDLREPLPIYTYKETKDAHSFLILLSEVKVKGARFNYRIKIKAENYFSELLSKNLTVFSHVAVVFKYKGLEKEFVFPDIEKYKTLEVKIMQHPNKNFIGKKIKPIISAGYKTYYINHGNLENWNTPIVIQFTR